MRNLKTILLTSIFFIFTSLNAQATHTPAGFADIVEPLFPAVVNISTTQKVSKNMQRRGVPSPFPEGSPFEEFNQFFERFAQPYREDDEDTPKNKHVSLGSGFIIDPKGYVVTNNHVIAEADEITVTLSTGKQLKAKVIGSDKKTDLALLKVKHDKPLPSVKFGDSDKSRIGDWVIAIGNPFGLGGSVTAGIISAHERDIHPDGLVDNFIQTDAAINRGNSGGPMFNMKGEVIGINTAILSPSGVYIGIGFATPSSVAKLVIEQLKTKGKVDRGMLGVKIQQLTEEIAEPLGLKPNQGALVVEVMKNGAAAKSGIRVGDVITEFEGQKIDNVRKLSRIVAEAPLKKELNIKLLRNGKPLALKVNLEQEQLPAKEKQTRSYSSFEVLGAEIATLTHDLRKKYNISNNVQGLILLNIPRKSLWYKKGFTTGDVIITANQKKLDTPKDLELIIKQAKILRKKSILLLVNRQGQTIFIPMEIK